MMKWWNVNLRSHSAFHIHTVTRYVHTSILCIYIISCPVPNTASLKLLHTTEHVAPRPGGKAFRPGCRLCYVACFETQEMLSEFFLNFHSQFGTDPHLPIPSNSRACFSTTQPLNHHSAPHVSTQSISIHGRDVELSSELSGNISTAASPENTNNIKIKINSKHP